MAASICLVLALLTFVSMTGARLLLTLYAIEFGAQPFTVGMLIATLQVVPLLVSLPMGRLADRHGTRWLMMLGFAAVSGAMLLACFQPSLTTLFVASALNGVLLGVNGVALQSVMGVVSRPEQRARNFSNLALAGSASNFVGPLLAGVSIDQLGYAGASLVLLSVAVMGMLSLLAWGERLPAGRGRRAAHAGRGLPPLRGLWQLLMVSALVQVCTDLFLFYVPVYGRSIALSATSIGVITAAFGVSTVLMRAIMPNLLRRLGEARMLAYSFYLAAAGFMLIPFFTAVAPLVAVSFLIGIGAGSGQPITMMMVVARSAEGRSGEMLGLQLTANGIARTGGPALLGVAGSLVGLAPVFVISALLMALGGVLSAGTIARQAGRAGTHGQGQ